MPLLQLLRLDERPHGRDQRHRRFSRHLQDLESRLSVVLETVHTSRFARHNLPYTAKVLESTPFTHSPPMNDRLSSNDESLNCHCHVVSENLKSRA